MSEVSGGVRGCSLGFTKGSWGSQGGRYSYKAVKQGGDYCVMLEMNEVSAGSQGFAGAHKGSRGSQVGRYSYKAVKQGGDFCVMLEMNEVSVGSAGVHVVGENSQWFAGFAGQSL